jgi:hypothetical protein
MSLARFLAPNAARLLSCAWSLVALGGCSNGDAGDKCRLEDADGIIGGTYSFMLRFDDNGFAPILLSGQNTADVTLTLVNEGTGQAGFSIDCLPTPNDDGCATEACFPASHAIGAIVPGTSATSKFKIPEVEGIYTFRALPDDDQRLGQFIVQ